MQARFTNIRCSSRALAKSLTPSSTFPSFAHTQSTHLPSLASHITVRGKRTKNSAVNSAAIQRLTTQLSVFSARKKQPRQLKLCFEDYLRHNTTARAWAIYQKNLRDEHEAQLQSQYAKIVEACNDLEAVSPFLASRAIRRENGKRFSPELRVPTETPPNTIWQEDWEPAPVDPKDK